MEEKERYVDQHFSWYLPISQRQALVPAGYFTVIHYGDWGHSDSDFLLFIIYMRSSCTVRIRVLHGERAGPGDQSAYRPRDYLLTPTPRQKLLAPVLPTLCTAQGCVYLFRKPTPTSMKLAFEFAFQFDVVQIFVPEFCGRFEGLKERKQNSLT